VTVNLGPLQAAGIRLDAQAPLAGTYQASLATIYGAEAHPLTLKITRTSVAQTVKLNGFDPVALDAISDPSFRFSIKETSGATVTLNPPVLTSLSMKLGSVRPRHDVHRSDVLANLGDRHSCQEKLKLICSLT
jgi:hypothetical protein